MIGGITLGGFKPIDSQPRGLALPARSRSALCGAAPVPKIVIIGGGVVGSSIAYYLALAGHAADAIVIEPDPTYEFAATPRATGGIRQLFTVPENSRPCDVRAAAPRSVPDARPVAHELPAQSRQ